MNRQLSIAVGDAPGTIVREVTFTGENAGEIESVLGDLYESWLPSVNQILLSTGTTIGVGATIRLVVEGARP